MLSLRDDHEMSIYRGKKDSFYVLLKMKIVFGIRTTDHGLWVELSTTDLLDLLMSGHKINMCKIHIFVHISAVSMHVSQNENTFLQHASQATNYINNIRNI